MTFGKDQLSDFSISGNLEWIETNGVGGYASATVSGANSRKYHGILVAAMHPPGDRIVLLAKLDETLVVPTRDGPVRFELGSNQFPGVVYPNGYTHLESFSRDLFPEFVYVGGDVKIKKTIAAIHGENTTLIIYDVLEAPDGTVLQLQPFASARDHHSLSHANDNIGKRYLFDNGIFRTLNYHGGAELFISVPHSEFIEQQSWYYNFEYLVELDRGQDFREDLYTHGKFSVKIRKGDTVAIIVSTEDPTKRNAVKLLAAERKRREKIIKNFTGHRDLKRLTLAADQFIVRRGSLYTILAGYHWFVDWGRDTMIALPGLCLVTGRYKEAKMILQQFAAHISEGMIPNRFMDHGEQAEYNTIDATLWYFYAIYKYYAYTKDTALIKSLLPVLDDVINWHYKGTRYGIKVDPSDELLTGGEDGVQLTWMDVKIGNWVVTPRNGKAVEINSLWFNALKITEHFHGLTGNQSVSALYASKAAKVQLSFNKLFWNDKDQYLYDHINSEKNSSLRPNQIFALSLPFPLVDKVKGVKILDAITNHLLTAKGLRSLSPDDKDYQPLYTGAVPGRDAAYHQGTVWSFFLGPYVDALYYTEPETAKEKARKVIDNFIPHLDEVGVGTVSEIFDGAFPHKSKGCIAQAWGVAEVLRVMSEYKLWS